MLLVKQMKRNENGILQVNNKINKVSSVLSNKVEESGKQVCENVAKIVSPMDVVIREGLEKISESNKEIILKEDELKDEMGQAVIALKK
jgi:hypothetical protein